MPIILVGLLLASVFAVSSHLLTDSWGGGLGGFVGIVLAAVIGRASGRK